MQGKVKIFGEVLTLLSALSFDLAHWVLWPNQYYYNRYYGFKQILEKILQMTNGLQLLIRMHSLTSSECINAEQN